MSDNSIQDITNTSTTPIITKISASELLILKDNVSVCIGDKGNTSRPYGVTWSATPSAVSYMFPYVLGLLPTHIEIRTLATQLFNSDY